jgi:hypothetical protein
MHIQIFSKFHFQKSCSNFSLNDNLKSSKHIKRRFRYVRKPKYSGIIALNYVQMAKNLADPFTKKQSRNMIDLASMKMD